MGTFILLIIVSQVLDWPTRRLTKANNAHQSGTGCLSAGNLYTKWSRPDFCCCAYTEPVVGDINDDGVPEVIVDTDNCFGAELYFACFNGTDGSLIWKKRGYRNILIWDVNNDGAKEVVWMNYDTLNCARGDGSIVWQKQHAGLSYETMLHPVGVSNIALAIGKKIGVVSGMDGSLVWSADSGYDVLAIGDVDNDGEEEVVSTQYAWPPDTISKFYCRKVTNGALVWEKEYAGIGVNYSAPVICDITDDGNKEIVCAGSLKSIFVIEGSSGNLLWCVSSSSIGSGGWTQNVISSTAAVADVILGNGSKEIIIGSCAYGAPQLDSCIYCLDGISGTTLWISKGTGPWGGPDETNSPAVADVDNDGQLEVIVTNHWGDVYCIDGATGGLEWKYTDPDALDTEQGPVVADVDADGKLEVVVADRAVLYVIDCDSSSGVEEEYSKEVLEAKVVGSSLYFSLPQGSEFGIAVYDVAGRKVVELFKGYKRKGEHILELPELRSGVYFIVLKGNNFKTQVRFNCYK